MGSRNGNNASDSVKESSVNGVLAEEILTEADSQESGTEEKMQTGPLCGQLENGGVPALKMGSAVEEDEQLGIQKGSMQSFEAVNNLQLQGDDSAKKIEVSGDSFSIFVQVFGTLDETFEGDDANCFGQYSSSTSDSEQENLLEREGFLWPDNREDRRAEVSDVQDFQFCETRICSIDGEETLENKVVADAVGSGDAIASDQDKVPINKAAEKKGENQTLLSEMEGFVEMQICENNNAEEASDLASIYWEREGGKYCREDIVKAECMVASSEQDMLALSLSSKTTYGKVSNTGNGDDRCEGKHESRERKKSRYLSPPYVNIKGGQKSSPISEENESEDVKEDVRLDMNSIASQSMESSPKVSGSGKNTRKKRSKRATNVRIMFGSAGTRVSSVEMLSELRSTALDCLYPNQSKYFNSAERFFSGFRSLAFHDEFNNAMPPKQSEDFPERVNVKQCKTTLATSAPSEQKVISFTASQGKYPQNFSHCPPGFLPKQRGRKKNAEKTLMGSDGKPANGSSAIDGSTTTSQSMVIDFQNGTLSPGNASVLNNNKKPQQGGSRASPQYKIIAGLPDLNGSSTSQSNNGNALDFSLKSPQKMDLFFPRGKPECKKRKKRERASGSLKSEVTSAIPDLNDNAALQETNFAIPEGKPRRKRGKNNTVNLIHNNMQTNGDALGTALLLKFASGSSMPSRETLIITFGAFGPLKVRETQILNDGSAQVVFVRSSDAVDAIKSLEKNSPFGQALVNYHLHYLSAASRAHESGGHLHTSPFSNHTDAFETPAKPSTMQPLHSEAPDLSYIRQNLEMMTSMLEKAGDDLSPVMRAKLEGEIKDLLNKVRNVIG